MDNDSLSFDYTEIKLNADWEGWGGGIEKTSNVCYGHICLHGKVDSYQSIYSICTFTIECCSTSRKCFITKNWIVNTNVIKSSCSENKFQIANLKNFVYTYLKICFNITILLYMLFLSIKCMHSIDNAVYALLNTIHATSFWMWRYNGLCEKNLITVPATL